MTIQFMKFKDCVNVFYNKKENKDIYQRLSLMTSVLDGNSIIFFKELDEKIVAAYVVNDYEMNTLETIFIQVDKEYRSNGLAKELMTEVIIYCKENNKKIITSNFSKEGEKYIKNQMRRIADRYNVEYYISIDEYKWFN